MHREAGAQRPPVRCFIPDVMSRLVARLFRKYFKNQWFGLRIMCNNEEMEYFLIFLVVASIAVVAILVFKFMERHLVLYLLFLRFIASWPFHIFVWAIFLGAPYITKNEMLINATWLMFFVYLSIVLPLNYGYALRGRRTELKALEQGDSGKMVEVRDWYKKVKIGFLVSVVVIIIWNLINA